MSWRYNNGAIATEKGNLISLSSPTSDCAKTPDGYLYLPKDLSSNAQILVPIMKSSNISSSDYRTIPYVNGCPVIDNNGNTCYAMMNKACVQYSFSSELQVEANCSGATLWYQISIDSIKSSVTLAANFDVKLTVYININGTTKYSEVQKSLSSDSKSNTTAVSVNSDKWSSSSNNVQITKSTVTWSWNGEGGTTTFTGGSGSNIITLTK